MRTLFLDTNALLHYPPISHIDWPAVAGTKPVKLIVCTPVIHELDEKKKDPLLKERARRVISELETAHASGGRVRDGVTLELQHHDLRAEDFPQGFSPRSADDAILVHVSQHVADHPGEAVAVVTEDFGMKLKCEARGVALVQLALETRLPDVSDEQTRKLREVQAMAARLAQALPELSIVLSAPGCGERDRVLRMTLVGAPPPLVLETTLARARWQFQLQAPPGQRDPFLRAIQAAQTAPIPAAEYDRYNREVGDYLAAVPAYVEAVNRYREACGRRFSFEVWLRNTGGRPAEDVDVRVYFPKGVRVFQKGRAPGEPAGPREPVQPRSAFELTLLRPQHNIETILRDLHRPSIPPKEKIQIHEAPWVIEATGYEVKHHYFRYLGEFVGEFESTEAMTSFEARYSILAGNHPLPTEDVVHFVLSGSSDEDPEE